MRSPSALALTLLLTLLAALGALALRPAPPSPLPPAADLTGVVLADGEPVSGAGVRVKGTRHCARTTADGRFRLPPRGERVTAWREGYFIAGARRSGAPFTLRLTPLPQEDNPAYEWVDPTPNLESEQNCGNCHAEIYREWSASGHARSARGRHFRDLYEGTAWDGRPGVSWGLLREHPDGAGVCSSCHAPSLGDNNPAVFDLRQVRGVASFGVHCDYCHKVAGVEGNLDGLSHGRFNLRLLRPREGQLFFGPLDDVDRGEDAYSPLYRDSRYCAACHEGVLFGVHVYSTYSEWLRSPARRQGKQCQDCHMTPTGTLTNLAPGRGGIRRDPRTLGNHRFFKGSQADMLRRCLRLSVRLERTQGGVRAAVRLSAEGVGHRVPTGFIDRQLLLVVDGLSANGVAVPLRAGPTLPAMVGRELAGSPGRLYARRLQDSEGRTPVPFWRGVPDMTDTRLRPGRVDEAVFVFGAALRRVRVRVLHRRFWQEVAQAKGWPDRDLLVLERSLTMR
jgi:hypothetical protein